jgi:hypothetical protein
MPTEPASTEDRRSIKISTALHSLVSAEAEKRGISMSDFLEVASLSLLDRTRQGFLVEPAFLLREVDALNVRLEHLVLSNMSLVEAAAALEGGALRSLIKTSEEAKRLVDQGKAKASAKRS